MIERPRMLAWAVAHDAHGISWDTLGFLPEGDRPETMQDWVRVPWLDEPATKATCQTCKDLRAALQALHDAIIESPAPLFCEPDIIKAVEDALVNANALLAVTAEHCEGRKDSEAGHCLHPCVSSLDRVYCCWCGKNYRRDTDREYPERTGGLHGIHIDLG